MREFVLEIFGRRIMLARTLDREELNQISQICDEGLEQIEERVKIYAEENKLPLDLVLKNTGHYLNNR